MSRVVIDRTTTSATALQPHKISQPQNINGISMYFSQTQQPQSRLARKSRGFGVRSENIKIILLWGYMCFVLLPCYTLSAIANVRACCVIFEYLQRAIILYKKNKVTLCDIVSFLREWVTMTFLYQKIFVLHL